MLIKKVITALRIVKNYVKRVTSAIFAPASQIIAPMPDTKSNQTDAERPPVFRTWNQLYAFTLIMHLLIVALFYLFKIAYS